MFGYVLPSAEQLTEDDRRSFQAAYCGLCHTLGRRYGLPGRMILNYDLTFLAMLLDKGDCRECHRRCLTHPLRKRMCHCGGAGMDTAADLSVILTFWQLQDGIADHGFRKGLKYRAAAILLRRAYRKARRLRPDFDESTRLRLEELAALERENCDSLDRPADAFARLLQSAARTEEDPVQQRCLAELFYHLGRWIYLIDAADDLKKDVADGSYNPLPLRYHLGGDTLDEESRQQLSATLDASVRAMAAAFELLPPGRYHALIENVVYRGLYTVTAAVLNGTYRKKPFTEK